MLNSFVRSLASFCAVSTDGTCFGSFVAGSSCGRVMAIFHDNMEIGPVDYCKENVTFGMSAFVNRAGMEMSISSHRGLRSAIYAGKVKGILMHWRNGSDADDNV